MERVTLSQLPFETREQTLTFLKQLWQQKPTACPLCGTPLRLLHPKAKKSADDWQCPRCDKTFRTLHLLYELNDRLPE